MLHSRRPLQDENSAFQAPTKQHADPEAPVSALKQPGGALPGLNSTRKALGNITNRAQQLDNQHPLKTPAAKLAPRKALGDITNATPKPQGLQSTRKPLSKLQTAAKGVQLQQRQKEDVWAEEGIEHTAGKTRKELDREAAARDDAEVAARVAAILSAPSANFSSGHKEGGYDWRKMASTQQLRAAARPPSRPQSPTLPSIEDLDLEDCADLLPEVVESSPGADVAIPCFCTNWD